MGGLRAGPEISYRPAAGALLLAVSKLVPPDLWVLTTVRVWSGGSLRGCIPLVVTLVSV